MFSFCICHLICGQWHFLHDPNFLVFTAVKGPSYFWIDYLQANSYQVHFFRPENSYLNEFGRHLRAMSLLWYCQNNNWCFIWGSLLQIFPPLHMTVHLQLIIMTFQEFIRYHKRYRSYHVICMTNRCNDNPKCKAFLKCWHLLKWIVISKIAFAPN